MEQSKGRARLLLTLVAFVSTGSAGYAGSIDLVVEETAGVGRDGWPVTSGVPLPAGALRTEAHAKLLSGGRELPLQTEVLSLWADGSIKWLLLDFQVDLRPKQKRRLVLRYGPGVKRSPLRRPAKVRGGTVGGGGATIEVGPLKLKLSAARFGLLDAVWLDLDGNGRFSSDERVTSSADGSGIVLVDSAGREFRADRAPAKVEVEQAGPLRVCVRIEGTHAARSGTMFRYVARVHAFRGQPYVRVFYTFLNDWPDDLMARIRAIDLQVALAGKERGPVRYVLGTEQGPLAGTVGPEGVRLFQVDDRSYRVEGNEAGRRALRRAQDAPVVSLSNGRRAPGWMGISTEAFGVAAGVRHFWQNWPKGLAANGRTLGVGICPAFAKGLYDGKPLEEDNQLYYYLHDGLYTFKVGAARTHEVWVLFHKGRSRASTLGAFFQAAAEPLLATCDPAHISATKALGEFPPADAKKYFGYDAWVDRALARHLERQEQKREYGMLNFGDWFGERKVNWGNLEYDLQHGLLVQYARTGDRRYFLRAEQAARHHIDVDVVHAVNAHLKNPWGDAPKVGEIWLHCLNHTGGYYQYGKVKLPVSKTYFMGHSRNWGHVWVGGDLKYYLFSGDRRALEVGLQIAEAMAASCPTRYGTHIRAQGWPMILLLEAYDLTRDRKYLDAAGGLWKVLKDNFDEKKGWVIKLAKPGHCRHKDSHCRGNVPFMEGLMLCALSRYHRITQDPEVLKAITVGIDQMIRECWVEKNKTFRYTACPLTPDTWHGLFLLCVEALAYEVKKTGNQEHYRILSEGLEAAIPRGGGSGFGKGLAQMIHFTPFGLMPP